MKNLLLVFLSLFSVTLIQGCGISATSESNLQDVSAEDADVKWLRTQFWNAAPIKNLEDLKPDKYWICRQRSAIKGASHTSRFWQMFFTRGAEVVGETTFYIDQREKLIGLYGVGERGTRGSFSSGETDRYLVPYEPTHQNVRKMPDGNLIVEWTTGRCATITGKNFSFLPEVVGQCPLMEEAIIGNGQGAFLYSVCETEKPIAVKRILTVAEACNSDKMCTLFKITATKHAPAQAVQTRTANRMLTYGSMQQSYYDVLKTGEGNCERYVQLPKDIFTIVISVVNSVERTGSTAELTSTQKSFLEFYLTLRKKADLANCNFSQL